MTHHDEEPEKRVEAERLSVGVTDFSLRGLAKPYDLYYTEHNIRKSYRLLNNAGF